MANEVQQIGMGGVVDGGAFLASFNGSANAALAWNASAAQAQTALEGLSTVGVGNVVCSGGPLPGLPIRCEFRNALGSLDLPAIVVQSWVLSPLTGTGPTVQCVTLAHGAPITAIPDLIGTLVARLRATTEVAALAGTRISAELQDSWDSPAAPMPKHAVVLRLAGGPADAFPGLPLLDSRIDLFCLGANGYEAMRLLRTVDPTLCPRDGRANGFTGAGCRVYWIHRVRGFAAVIEPDTGWPSANCSYQVRWCGVPAA